MQTEGAQENFYWLFLKRTISGLGISSAKCLPHKDEDPVPSTNVKVQGSNVYQLAQLNNSQKICENEQDINIKL